MSINHTLEREIREEEEAFALLDSGAKDREKEIQEKVLRLIAEAILYWVEQPNVEEVFINRPTEIWLKLRERNSAGLFWERKYDKNLTRETLINMFHWYANSANTSNFGPTGNPVSNGTLPGGHRFMAAYGPNFQYNDVELDPIGTTLFACRQQNQSKERDFDSWGLKRGKTLDPWRPEDARRADSNDPITKIKEIIKRGEHILLSGETNVGKTSFINRLLRLIPMDRRICTIQDTLELSIPQKNKFTIYMPRQGKINDFNYGSVIDMIVRMNTDTNIYGEVSSTNAAAILEGANSGNANFITSIHAGSAKEAKEAFVQRYEHTHHLDSEGREEKIRQIDKTFHIVQLIHDKKTNERRIVEIT